MLTPGRIWEATSPAEVVDALNVWFGGGDLIEGLELLETDAFADCQRVGYRPAG